MKFTIEAKGADDISPMLVATEDPAEALKSVRDFSRANLLAKVFDDIGRPIEPEDLEKLAADASGNPN